MFKKMYFEDYGLGESRTTLGRTITEADLVIHAGQTGDFFPHHMDEEWCKTQPFKHRIAHGTLVFSVSIGLTASLINEAAMTYGYDRLRFTKPVYINDTIKVNLNVVNKKDHKSPQFGMVTEKVEVFNQHEELVMVCDHILIVQRMNFH
jgi:acyl dehydratase